MEDNKRKAYSLIRNIFWVLMVLSLIEVGISIYLESTVLLMIVALLKAGLVVYYFMHIYRLWRPEEHA